MRKASVARNTKETKISARLNIDGKGRSTIRVPIGFLSHMLQTFSKTGAFDLNLIAKGDLRVDQHHTVEDTGLVLGQAFRQALGDKKGINRAGFFAYPMDEALALVAVDIGGRPFCRFEAGFRRRFCGELDLDTLEDFFCGFSTSLAANVVVKMPCGRSDHHKAEAIFKAFGKAMKMACSVDRKMIREIPSTKGVI